MLCFNCKKRNAVHIVNKDGVEEGLCDDCYRRLAAAAAFAGTDSSFLASLSETSENEQADFSAYSQPKRRETVKKCPNCGTTLTDYSRTGLVGCSVCYETFRAELTPVIRRIHGKTTHEGKRPLGVGALYELLEVQKRLRGELEAAIRERRMSDAEQLNRDIREVSQAIERRRTGGSHDQ